ncbi:MAG: ATP-binding cassette domain-containing protein, partial [Congregibacter sp.]|nr:ATP-binding cassette domain-containing protein [Congregibacter sp.]
MLEMIDVSHSYHARRSNFEKGLHRVLDGVSLKLYRGQTLGILGRNGAGKTTMLRLMGGILAPSRGEIHRQPGARYSLLTLGLGFQPQLTGRD